MFSLLWKPNAAGKKVHMSSQCIFSPQKLKSFVRAQTRKHFEERLIFTTRHNCFRIRLFRLVSDALNLTSKTYDLISDLLQFSVIFMAMILTSTAYGQLPLICANEKRTGQNAAPATVLICT